MVSIIIPLKQDQGYLKACIEACLEQSKNDGIEMEIVVLPDDPFPWMDSRITMEVTGPVSPARKRNRGAQLSKGDILAFIDDDTRPQPGWLKASLHHFTNPAMSAVGGPSITPASDSFRAQISGAVYESWMMSGRERRRYLPLKECDVHDFPSCNLLVRKSVFNELGGFGTDFWPGEDTEFCLALVKKGYRIRYEPRAIVEHHRRPSLRRHFIQLGNYGLHRGYFAKRYPETSLRFQYFVPTLFVLSGTALSVLTILGQTFWGCLLMVLGSLYFLLGIFSLAGKPFKLLIGALFVMLVSHVVYGIFFLRGLLAQRLPEENPK